MIFFQSVENWFDSAKSPKGYACVRNQKNTSVPALQAILIVHGSSHCRLEDLDDSGRWNKDIQFQVGNHTVKRKKGASARGAMRAWLKLRQELGEEQFLRVRVCCQYAAWADGVISQWILELLASFVYQSIRTSIALLWPVARGVRARSMAVRTDADTRGARRDPVAADRRHLPDRPQQVSSREREAGDPVGRTGEGEE